MAKNLLFLIAIDEYDNPLFPNLCNAKIDGNRFVKILHEEYGFELISTPLYDKFATRHNIIKALDDLTLKVKHDDSLILYYAGHGHRHPILNKGFWIPSDSSTLTADFIPNSTIVDYIQGISAKHILIISDSCFSGTFITQQRSIPNNDSYEKLNLLCSRWVLASGREEVVSDGQPGVGSPFANCLCNFLEMNRKQKISFLEIGQEVMKNTGKLANQQPIVSHIENSGHKGGQMIFRLSEKSTHNFYQTENQLLQNIVAPFELSKKLFEIGIDKETVFGYYSTDLGLQIKRNTEDLEFVCPAYLSSELIRHIPDEIEVDTNTYIARFDGWDRVTKKQLDKWPSAEVTYQKTGTDGKCYMAICRYDGRMVAFSKTKDGVFNNLISWGFNESEAIGEMILDLHREKKIK